MSIKSFFTIFKFFLLIFFVPVNSNSVKRSNFIPIYYNLLKYCYDYFYYNSSFYNNYSNYL